MGVRFLFLGPAREQEGTARPKRVWRMSVRTENPEQPGFLCETDPFTQVADLITLLIHIALLLH